jgi:hypothetical protein
VTLTLTQAFISAGDQSGTPNEKEHTIFPSASNNNDKTVKKASRRLSPQRSHRDEFNQALDKEAVVMLISDKTEMREIMIDYIEVEGSLSRSKFF